MNYDEIPFPIEPLTDARITYKRLAYLERCAVAVEWVEKFQPKVEEPPATGMLWNVLVWNPKTTDFTDCFQGSTFLTAVEAAMKEV